MSYKQVHQVPTKASAAHLLLIELLATTDFATVCGFTAEWKCWANVSIVGPLLVVTCPG